MPRDRWKILFFIYFNSISINALTSSCPNISLSDQRISQISNVKNLNCSWIIDHRTKDDSYLLSLRVIQWKSEKIKHELIFQSDHHSFVIKNSTQRIWKYPTSKPLEIIYRSSSSPGLSVDRFVLEWIYVEKNETKDFQCEKGDQRVLPWQWICNCLNECSDGDQSDEINCPWCQIGKTDLRCRSNEFWCLSSLNRQGQFLFEMFYFCFKMSFCSRCVH